MVTLFEPFTPHKTENSGGPHVTITVEKEDILYLERIVTIRGADYKIDTNTQHINITEEFDNLYNWGPIMKDLYNIDIVKDGIPRFLLRDFYKLSFLDPARNGFLERDYCLRNDRPEKAFDFPVSSFWDKSKFKQTMHDLDKFYSLDLDLSDLSIHDEFIQRLHFHDTRNRAIEVIFALKKGKDIDITNLDTVEEAFISAWIEKNHDFITVPLLTNNFFSTTTEINQFLALYPEHYKAMNPNLPRFKDMVNPFYLAKLKK